MNTKTIDKANEASIASELPKSWLVIEVEERKLRSVLLCTCMEGAVNSANDLLEKYMERIGYGERLAEIKKEMEEDPDADIHTGEIQFAQMDRDGAWCNYKNNWDAFTIETSGVLPTKPVKQAMDRLVKQNSAKLMLDDLTSGIKQLSTSGGSHAEGYREALTDVMKELEFPMP